jgi:hypothetical protein
MMVMFIRILRLMSPNFGEKEKKTSCENRKMNIDVITNNGENKR